MAKERWVYEKSIKNSKNKKIKNNWWIENISWKSGIGFEVK